MDTEGLKSALEAWLQQNPDWQTRLFIDSAADRRIICSLEDLRITFDFLNRSFIQSSSKPDLTDWENSCDELLSSVNQLDPASLQAFFTQVFSDYDTISWDRSQDSEDDYTEKTMQIYSGEYYGDHPVFRAAFEAKTWLESEKPGLQLGLIYLIRRENRSIQLKIDLSRFEFLDSDYTQLGLSPDENELLLTLTYPKSLLNDTTHEPWSVRLYTEVDISIQTNKQVLHLGLTSYFPGIIRLIFEKLQRKTELPPGIVLDDKENELVMMGFDLKDVKSALMKAKWNMEVAMEKLLKMVTRYEWINTEESNPFTCLYLSLNSFLQVHRKYCVFCYQKHKCDYEKLRYCSKRRCLEASVCNEFEVLKAIKSDPDTVQFDISYFSFLAYWSHPMVAKFLDPLVFSTTFATLPPVNELSSTCTTEQDLIRHIGPHLYSFLKKLLQFSPLKLKKVTAADLNIDDDNITHQLRKENCVLYRLESNSLEKLTSFESEKVASGSSYGFSMMANQSRQFIEDYLGAFLIPPYLRNMDLTSNWSMNAITPWEHSMFKSRVGMAVVEYVSKAGHSVSVDGQLPKQTVIRYIATVPAVRPYGEVFSQVSSGEVMEPRSTHLEHPGPSYSPFGARDYHYRPSPPPVSFQPVPFVLPTNQAPDPFPQVLDLATLTPEQLSLYNKIKVQQRTTYARLVKELMEVVKAGNRAALDQDENLFMWHVDVQVDADWDVGEEMRRDMEVYEKRLSRPLTLSFNITFSAFFPVLPPFLVLTSPSFASILVTEMGFVVNPPKWNSEGTITEHINKVARHVLEFAGTRLDLTRL